MEVKMGKKLDVDPELIMPSLQKQGRRLKMLSEADKFREKHGGSIYFSWAHELARSERDDVRKALIEIAEERDRQVAQLEAEKMEIVESSRRRG